jgi:hypothetical protein
VHVDHGPADHPGGVGVVHAGVDGVVVADVLQVAGTRVEPQPAGGIGVGQTDPPPGTEHAPLVRERDHRFVEHAAGSS